MRPGAASLEAYFSFVVDNSPTATFLRPARQVASGRREWRQGQRERPGTFCMCEASISGIARMSFQHKVSIANLHLRILHILYMYSIIAGQHHQTQGSYQQVLEEGVVVQDDRDHADVRQEANSPTHYVLLIEPPLATIVENSVITSVVITLQRAHLVHDHCHAHDCCRRGTKVARALCKNLNSTCQHMLSATIPAGLD